MNIKLPDAHIPAIPDFRVDTCRGTGYYFFVVLQQTGKR